MEVQSVAEDKYIIDVGVRVEVEEHEQLPLVCYA